MFDLCPIPQFSPQNTPNIDRLAREGVTLTDFYANGAD
jgi:arylsulfatase A-like enzyme